jgi:hypothetical protein
MRKSLRVLVLVSVSLAGLGSKLSAQQATQVVEKEQANTSEGIICDPPATLADLEKATNEIKAQVRSGDEKSAAEINALTAQTEKTRMEVINLQNQSIHAAEVTEQKLHEQKSLLAGLAQAVNREEQARKWWFLCGTVGFLALVVLAIWGIVIARRNSRTAEVIAVQTVVTKEEELVDPDVRVLREYSARNGGKKLVPFVLTLPNQGVQFYCTAQLRDGQLPLVSFEGEDGFVQWEKRKQTARALFDQGKGMPISEKLAS